MVIQNKWICNNKEIRYKVIYGGEYMFLHFCGKEEQIVSNLLSFLIGAILSVLILGIAYLLVMFFYCKLRKKMVHKKYKLEFIMVIIIIIMSLFMKMIIYYVSNSTNLQSGINAFFESFYYAIGNLTLSNFEEFNEKHTWLIVIYNGITILSFLLFASIITARANYEIYSTIILSISKLFLKETYIFTAVTEDTLQLAKSIRQNNKKANIIFSSDHLGVFDRKDPLHREIMYNNYIYIEGYKSNNSNKRKSIIKKLGLFKSGSFSQCRKIHLLAMENNEKLSGLESENSAIIFDELKLIIKEYLIKDKYLQMPEIYFYVLTDTEIDYNFYTKEFENIIKEMLKDRENGKLIEKVLKKQLIPNVINEAILSGKSLYMKKNSYDFRYEHMDHPYRTFVLGFGDTGKEAMKQLYISDAFVDENDKSTQFIAEVFDKDVDNISGIFKENYPLFVCLASRENNIKSYDQIRFDYSDIHNYYEKKLILEENLHFLKIKFEKLNEQFKTIYGGKGIAYVIFSYEELDGNILINIDEGDILHQEFDEMITDDSLKLEYEQLKKQFKYHTVILSRNEEEFKVQSYIASTYYNEKCCNLRKGLFSEKIDDIIDHMKFPIVNFHKFSCFSIEFTDFMNKSFEDKNNFVSSIIISLGNDELNIKMANTIITKMKHNSRDKDSFPFTIYVNLRDENNNCRINWNLENEEYYHNFKVIIFGNSKEIYSYENIIDHSEAKEYNVNYNWIDQKSKLKESLSCIMNAPDTKDFLKEYEEALKNQGKNDNQSIDDWNTISLIRKESNESARLYNINFTNKELFKKGLIHNSKIEKNRWNRFYICQGYVPGIVKDESKKEHDCLISYKYLKDDVKPYDAINVILGCYKNKKGEKNNG